MATRTYKRPVLARIIALCVAATLPILFEAAAAQAETSHIQMLDVSHDTIKFLDSHVVTIPGEHTASGCRWTIDQPRRPGEGRVGAQEIGRDTVACIDVVRMGHVDPATLPVSVPRAGSVDPCADEYFGWYDPFGLLLTDVDTGGCFSYDGINVSNCSLSYNNTYAEAPTGWYKNYQGGTGVSYDAYLTQCFAWSDEQFNNNTFCPAGSTQTNYFENKLVMEANGSVTSGTTSWDSGQCTNLLHFWSNH